MHGSSLPAQVPASVPAGSVMHATHNNIHTIRQQSQHTSCYTLPFHYKHRALSSSASRTLSISSVPYMMAYACVAGSLLAQGTAWSSANSVMHGTHKSIHTMH
jgi:hypothetical protein